MTDKPKPLDIELKDQNASLRNHLAHDPIGFIPLDKDEKEAGEGNDGKKPINQDKNITYKWEY